MHGGTRGCQGVPRSRPGFDGRITQKVHTLAPFLALFPARSLMELRFRPARPNIDDRHQLFRTPLPVIPAAARDLVCGSRGWLRATHARSLADARDDGADARDDGADARD